jgi:hypothetical protein
MLRTCLKALTRLSRRPRRARPRIPARPGGATRLVVEALEERAVPSFAAPVTYSAGPSPWGVTAADLRRIATLDLAVADFTAVGKVSVLLGNGDGTFNAPVQYDTGSNGPVAVAAGDFTNDGILDLVVLNFNNGQNVVSVLPGNGDGTFQPPIVTTVGGSGGRPQSLAVGDFNGDGNLDVVTADPGGSVHMLLGNGDGTFQPPETVVVGGSPQSVAVSDLRGNGTLDLVTADYGNTVSVLLANGDGTFQPPVHYAGAPLAVAVALGDVNGDGALDIVAADQESQVSVFLNNGDGTFGAPSNFPLAASPGAVVLGDFNGDGKLDIAATGGNSVSVLLGNGDGTFQGPQTYAAGPGPIGLAVGDFNGDGFPDLAVADQGGDTVAVLRNNADWSGPGGGGTPRALPSQHTRPAGTPAGASSPGTTSPVLHQTEPFGAPARAHQTGPDQTGTDLPFADSPIEPALVAFPWSPL